MSCDGTYPFPQVFVVDGGGQPPQPAHPPSLVPCWSRQPPQRKRGKSWGFMGVSAGVALGVLMLFLLVFVALGFEASQIYGMQKELQEMKEVKPLTDFDAPQKQTGLNEPDEVTDDRPAAHLMGRIEKEQFSKTLRWEPQAGRAFLSGGVSYRFEDGALQINETGLYHVYARVELIFKDCSPTSFFVHSVFLRRGVRRTSLTLMEAHRAGFCTQKPGHPWTTESYLGSALQLQKNDRVFVNVSHPSYLSHASYANFFGLYKI
ncbi:tumor necrosis factor ligand superfamily member 6 [Brachionichthys hirsutus]|uniref:tumor necrosis factor ligand superfamily member 6 n=1 Tax=Brachionichthys hirsutus TaxID=412623 RepID=UPI0036053B3C